MPASTTTEIALLPLIPGSEPGDPSNPAAQVIKECTDTITQQRGFQRMRIGTAVENPSDFQMMIDWDSKAAHEEFIASEAYGPFLNRFKSILADAPKLTHVDFPATHTAQAALGAPVTEIATFYFDGGPPADALEQTTKFMHKCLEGRPETKVLGWAYGTTYEEVEREGVKGKAAVLLVGWGSVDEHMELRQTEVFKENAGLLRQNAAGIEMHHVAFMDVVAT